MSQIALSQISPGPSELNQRFLNYRVVRTNTYWWQLRISIPVRYRWAFEYAGFWTEDRKQSFKSRLEANAASTWSRRYRLRNRSDIRVEVLVALQEGSAPANELWHVLVYPQESGETYVPRGLEEPIERVVCNYHYRGWPHDLPRPVQSAGELRNAAVCFLRESSVRCTPTPGDQSYTQRGGDHEVGHMLGMLHPGGICSESACYGTTGAQRNRIMGAGHQVTVADYAFAMKIMNQESHARLGQRLWALEPDRRSSGVSTCA